MRRWSHEQREDREREPFAGGSRAGEPAGARASVLRQSAHGRAARHQSVIYMRKTSCFLFLSVIALAQNQPESDTCSITLRAVNSSGLAEPYILKSFKDAKDREFASRFKDGRGTVPCGQYQYEMRRSNVSVPIALRTAVTGQVSAMLVETLWTVFIPPELGIRADGQPVGSANRSLSRTYALRGVIKNMTERRLWVTLHSAAASASSPANIEAEVSSDGRFSFTGIFRYGPYVLTVMNDRGQIVHLLAVDSQSATPTEPVVIVLPTRHPEVLILR